MPVSSIRNSIAGKPALTLKRVLGLTTGILMVAGIMIGSGIFKKIAPMAALGLQADDILLAWLVAGLMTLLGAVAVSGLAEITSESGGEYEYLRKVYGRFAGFVFGWASFTIIGSASIAAMGFIFAQSVHALIPLFDAPPSLAEWEWGGFFRPFSDAGIKCLSIASIIAVTWVNRKGTRKGANLFNSVTYAKLLGILFLIILGLFFVTEPTSASNELAKPIQSPTGSYGYYSVFFAAMLSAFWAYDGWLNVAFISGEIRNPGKNIPLAMLIGVLLVMVLYLLINYAFLQAIPVQQLAALKDQEIAASVMAGSVLGKGGLLFISILIMLCTFGALNGMIITYARLYFKMAEDGQFFASAAEVHPTYLTPHKALNYSMIMSCFLVFSGSFDQLTNMAIFTGFFFYMMLALGVIHLKRKGIISRKLPGYPYVQILFILFSFLLLLNTIYTQPMETIIGILFILCGLPLYFYFNKKNRAS